MASALSEADIDRFATLFSPATPPATPTNAHGNTLLSPPLPLPPPHVGRARTSTQGSADSDFGAFVCVPPSQDPLRLDVDVDGDGDGNGGGTGSSTAVMAPATTEVSLAVHHDASADTQGRRNHSLVYFDQFTSSARTAAERQRREVLDELLKHQDDPMYFHFEPDGRPTGSTTSVRAVPEAMGIPAATTDDEALAEALASEISNPKLIRVLERGGSVKVAPNPSRSRLPLPPRLSGSASPPSLSFSSPNGSSASLATATSSPLLPPPSDSGSGSASSLPSTSTPTQHPAHATLSRISSSLVSLLPSARPRSATSPPPQQPTQPPSSASAPIGSGGSRFHVSSPGSPAALTHGSPFNAVPYIPPTGAPGFAGDRAWDRGFSEVLAQEEARGLVDTVGLGIGTDALHARHGHGHGHGHGKTKGVALLGRREGTAKVLSEDMANLIRPHLPPLTKLPRQWTLLYSLDQHGISLNTLYARCEPRIPSRAQPHPPKGGLLVVQDAHDAVFGAWLSEGVKLEKGAYYGSGEAFLWRYHPPVQGKRHPREIHEREVEEVEEGRMDVYPWTGANAYVALCEPDFFSFGGGDGHYGLYVDASLLEGSSAPCPTFGNPALCLRERGHRNGSASAASAKEVAFECVGLEVWGIGSDEHLR